MVSPPSVIVVQPMRPNKNNRGNPRQPITCRIIPDCITHLQVLAEFNERSFSREVEVALLHWTRRHPLNEPGT